MAAPHPELHILIVIDTSMTWRTEVIRGIDDFSRTRPGWYVHVEGRQGPDCLEAIRRWTGHGVIARVMQPALARADTK